MIRYVIHLVAIFVFCIAPLIGTMRHVTPLDFAIFGGGILVGTMWLTIIATIGALTVPHGPWNPRTDH
jgi:hypothetical protein